MTSLPIEGVPPGRPNIESRWQSLVGADRGDRVYRRVLTGFALALPVLILIILGVLFVDALPALRRFGPSFLWTSTWDPIAEIYGAAPMIFGTLASSLLALLAAIPSVVYGLWGIFVLIPFLRSYVVPPLKAVFGWTPFLQGVFYGNSLFAGGIILAIMIVPYIAAVSREVLLAVPASQREAALAMGATRWEAVRSAVLPYGRVGLMGAIILGLGRALGETMAVTMLIGNRHDISVSLLQPAYTMAAAIANEFSEATTGMYQSALVEVGLILFVLTVAVNAVARILIWRVARGAAVGSKAL